MDLERILSDIRVILVKDDHTLTERAYEHLQFLFRFCTGDPERQAALQQQALDYNRDEFFVCVDRAGRNVVAPARVVDDVVEMAGRLPELGQWLRVVRSQGGGSTLLVARWLAHVAGLRHRTVQLLLDPAESSDYTYVQLRSPNKTEFPGTLDVAVAGHVQGLEPVEATIAQELRDELNLEIERDLDAFRPVRDYAYEEHPGGGAPAIVEFRHVFRARLKTEAIARVRFTDGEVGGLCLCTIAGLRAYVERFPERVAPGLRGSLICYQEL